MVVIVGGFNKVLVGTFFGHSETSRKVRCWLYRDRGNKNIRNSIAAPRLADLATGPLGQPRHRHN